MGGSSLIWHAMSPDFPFWTRHVLDNIAMRRSLFSFDCNCIRLTVTDQPLYKQLSSPWYTPPLPQDGYAHYRPLPAAECGEKDDHTRLCVCIQDSSYR